MNEHLNLDKFTKYVGAHVDLLPLMSFEARAIVADAAPQKLSEIPSGWVILYPAFVVFLTAEKPAAGVAVASSAYVAASAAYPDSNTWNDVPSATHTDLARVAVGEFRDVDVMENALASPYSVFVPVEDVTEVIAGRHLMTHHHITVATPLRKLQLCQDDTKPHGGSVMSHLFGGWQTGFIATLQELAHHSGPGVAAARSGQVRFVTDLYGNPLPVGSRGTETNENGDAIYGDDQSYKKDLYYGRVSHGAELMLMSNVVSQNEFDLDIIKVKVLTNEWEDEIGAVGWVDLEDTSFQTPDDA